MRGKKLIKVHTLSFDEAVKATCSQVIEGEKAEYRSEFESFESFQDKVRIKYTQGFKDYRESFENGYQLVNKLFDTPSKTFEIPKKLLEKITNPGSQLYLSNGSPIIQELVNYSGVMMSQVYDLATSLQKDNQIQKASDLFLFLTTLNPFVSWFWLGLGNTWVELLRLEEALCAYGLGIQFDPMNIENYRSAIECCKKLNKESLAFQLLEYGKERLEYLPIEKEVRQKLINDLNFLKAGKLQDL